MALTIVKKEISLNVGQPNNFELICAMQGDSKSFEITATLYDVNKLYTINTNNIKIQGINPVGLKIDENVDSHTTNTVTFTLTEKMLMYDGLLRLVIIFTDGGQLTTFPFIIKVVNSPGNTTADDVKTISELVEEARQWAMLSKSYAVGTDNVVRPGDATDNSKFYYEQIKKLLGNGNANILYYDTYEEFEADAANIPLETLIVIKESILDVNIGNSGSTTPETTLKIVTWADGTDEEIKAMLDAHYAGEINISDYWNIGDERKIHLSAIPETQATSTIYSRSPQPAQDVELVIIGIEHDNLSTSINGHSKAAITVHQKNCLSNMIAMNSIYGDIITWEVCAIRTWCNDMYKSALPNTLASIIKTVKKQTSAGSGSTTIKTTQDDVFLLSEIEVIGRTDYSVAGEGEQYSCFGDFKISRDKTLGYSSNTKCSWYLRSPYSGNNSTSDKFCYIANTGLSGYPISSSGGGLAPSFCL